MHAVANFRLYMWLRHSQLSGRDSILRIHHVSMKSTRFITTYLRYAIQQPVLCTSDFSRWLAVLQMRRLNCSRQLFRN